MYLGNPSKVSFTSRISKTNFPNYVLINEFYMLFIRLNSRYMAKIQYLKIKFQRVRSKNFPKNLFYYELGLFTSPQKLTNRYSQDLSKFRKIGHFETAVL